MMNMMLKLMINEATVKAAAQAAGAEVEALAEVPALEAEPLELEPPLPPQAARLRTMARAIVIARNFFMIKSPFQCAAGKIPEAFL